MAILEHIPLLLDCCAGGKLRPTRTLDTRSRYPPPCVDPFSPHPWYSEFSEAITPGAKDCGMVGLTPSPREIPADSANERKQWYDAECRQLRSAFRKAHRASVKSDHSPERASLRQEAKKWYTKCIATKEAEFLRSLREQFCNVKNPAEFCKAIKFFRQQAFIPPSVQLDKWNDFYTKTYPPRANRPFMLASQGNAVLDRNISAEELEKVLLKAKTGKAAGQTAYLMIFCLPCNWRAFLLEFYNQIFTCEILPEYWTRIIMTMLHKKGDRAEPANYRV